MLENALKFRRIGEYIYAIDLVPRKAGHDRPCPALGSMNHSRIVTQMWLADGHWGRGQQVRIGTRYASRVLN